MVISSLSLFCQLLCGPSHKCLGALSLSLWHLFRVTQVKKMRQTQNHYLYCTLYWHKKKQGRKMLHLKRQQTHPPSPPPPFEHAPFSSPPFFWGSLKEVPSSKMSPFENVSPLLLSFWLHLCVVMHVDIPYGRAWKGVKYMYSTALKYSSRSRRRNNSRHVKWAPGGISHILFYATREDPNSAPPPIHDRHEKLKTICKQID